MHKPPSRLQKVYAGIKLLPRTVISHNYSKDSIKAENVKSVNVVLNGDLIKA